MVLHMHEDIHPIVVIVMTGSKKVCQVRTSASFDEVEQRAKVSEDTESGRKEDQSTLLEEADEKQVNNCSYMVKSIILWL